MKYCRVGSGNWEHEANVCSVNERRRSLSFGGQKEEVVKGRSVGFRALGCCRRRRMGSRVVPVCR